MKTAISSFMVASEIFLEDKFADGTISFLITSDEEEKQSLELRV